MKAKAMFGRDLRNVVRQIGLTLPVWLALASTPAAHAAAYPTFATARAGGQTNTSSAGAATASGTESTERAGLSMASGGSAYVDFSSRVMKASTTMDVSTYTCGTSYCLASGSAAGGTIQDTLLAYSPSAGSHSITLIFAPIEYDGKVSFGNIYGFPAASVQMSGSVVATVRSTVPGTYDTVFTDNYPKTFSFYTDMSAQVSGHSNGLSVTVANTSSFDMAWNWNIQAALIQGGSLTGVTPKAHGSMTADFMNTVKWGGVVRAYDTVTGKTLTDLQLTSSLGTDWSKPTSIASVPEPGAWLLFMVGCAIVLTAKASKKRSF